MCLHWFPKRECVPIRESQSYLCFVMLTRDRVISRFLIGKRVPERNLAARRFMDLLSITYGQCFSLALKLIIE